MKTREDLGAVNDADGVRVETRRTVPWILWLVLVLAMLAVVHDAVAQANWLGGFFRSFGEWIHDPTTSLGTWHPRLPPLSEVVAGVVYVAVGCWASLIVLQRTRMEGDRVALLGLTPILTISAAGVVGTFVLVLGVVSAPGLVVATAILVGALALVTWRIGGWSRILHPYGRQRSSTREVVDRSRALVIGQWWTSGVVTLILLLVTLRDLISPVVEWDATVYHSELARLWFLERPDPALIFGPSLGVQISANYPPLFPASGLVANISADRVTDVALRLASPMLLLGLLLLVFSFTRVRLGVRAAWWSVLLLGTTPLAVLYASWSTSYLLTTALGFAAIVFCIEAAEQGSRRLWGITGVLLGLAILSSFYGWLFLIVVIPAVLLRHKPWRVRCRDGLWVLASTGLVAGVWLLRNWIDLGDPLYPLSVPLLHGRGLSGPLWRAAQAELRVNANSYWGGSHSLLRVRQLVTVLFDRHLLIIGSLPIVVLVWRRNIRRLDKRYIALAAAVLLGAELVPGWFWLRSLLPALPFLAIGGGVLLAELGGFAGRRPGAVREPRARLAAFSRQTLRGSTALLFVGLALVGGVVALALAVAGPGQGTWTTQLPSSSNFMTLDSDLGSASSTLWSVFGGDAQAWVWLNQHARGERIATFDIRAEYLDHPGTILYLDGEQAEPLLTMNTSLSALAFFRRQHVRYIFLPAWSAGPGATRDPAVDLLPLHRFLGDADFPLVASFAPSAAYPLSNIYQVGGPVEGVQSALFPGASSPAPGAGGPYVFASESDDGWIFAPVLRAQHETLRIRYFDSSQSDVSFNAYVSGGTWDLDVGSVQLHATHRWREATISLPPSSTGVTALSVNVGHGTFRVASAVVVATR